MKGLRSIAGFITLFALFLFLNSYLGIGVYIPKPSGQNLEEIYFQSDTSARLEDFQSNQNHIIIPVPVPEGDFYNLDDQNVKVLLAKDGINDHTIIQDEHNRWHLIALSGKEWVTPIQLPIFDLFSTTFEHAVSDDLFAPMSEQSMIVPRQLDEFWLWAPHAIRRGNTTYIFYTDSSKSFFTVRGNRMKVLKGNFNENGNFLELPGSRKIMWSNSVDRDPMVLYIKDKNLFILYYCTSGAIAYRTSSDLETWSAPSYALTGAGNDPESPFVVEYNNLYYLFVTDTGDGDQTEDGWNEVLVYASTDPFSFGDAYSNYITTIHAHATEVLEDNGIYYITSVNPTPGPDAAVRITALNWPKQNVPIDKIT